MSASSTVTGRSEGRNGAVSLDLELVKPLGVATAAADRIERSGSPDTVWLEYAYRKHHWAIQRPRASIHQYLIS